MKKLSKKEYAVKMQEQRASLYSLSNQQLKIIVSDPHHLTQFLSLMATINYTVNNSLLVYAQKPYAKELKTLEKWSKSDVHVNKGEKGIKILEPTTEYTRKDGSRGMNYSLKYVFDISQTDGIEKDYQMDKDAIRAGIIDSSCPIVVSSNPSQLYPVEYDSTNNQMNVLSNISYEDELNGLFKASAMKESMNQIPSHKQDFISNCVGYMLSIRFHIPNYNTFIFTGVMENYFRNMNEQEIKNELNLIYKIYKPIKDRINHGIYMYQKS